MKLLKISALALSMSFVFASCSEMNMDDFMDDLKKKKPDQTEQPGDNKDDHGNGDGNTGGGDDHGNTGGGNGNTGGGDDY